MSNPPASLRAHIIWDIIDLAPSRFSLRRERNQIDAALFDSRAKVRWHNPSGYLLGRRQ
jgi:hypothetical protein